MLWKYDQDLIEEWKGLRQLNSHIRSVALTGESDRICLFAVWSMAQQPCYFGRGGHRLAVYYIDRLQRGPVSGGRWRRRRCLCRAVTVGQP